MPRLKETKFGFFPSPLAIQSSTYAIIPLTNYTVIADSIRRSPCAHGKWFEPASDGSKNIHPVRFELPATHLLRLTRSKSTDLAGFLIYVLGFLTGVRTVPELIATIFPHPTLSEMMYESVLDAYGRALHM